MLTNNLQINLQIVDNRVLDATGHQITISGGGKIGLLRITNANVVFRNLTLTDGYVRGASTSSRDTQAGTGAGAAVFAQNSKLTFISCLLSNNLSEGGLVDDYFGTNGNAIGGALYLNGGELTMNQSIWVSNQANGGPGPVNFYSAGNGGGNGFGGAIALIGASLTATNCIFSNNVASSLIIGRTATVGNVAGGAIYLVDSPATFSEIVCTSNRCSTGSSQWDTTPTAQGGAIFTDRLLLMVGSRIEGNSVVAATTRLPGPGEGGALFGSNTLTLIGTTFAYNSAQGGFSQQRGAEAFTGGDGRGGAVFSAGTLAATNCTFAFNNVQGGGSFREYGGKPGGADGAALYVTGSAVLAYVTIASNNAAAGSTGDPGLPEKSSGPILFGSASLLGSVLANGTNANLNGTITDLGYNISSDASVSLTGPGSRTGMAPLLGEFGFYGGLGQTFSLLENSPAIDSANSANFPSFDQRGIPRPQKGAPDIGSFELVGFPSNSVLSISITTASDARVIHLHIKNESGLNVQLQRSRDLLTWENFGPISANAEFDLQDDPAVSQMLYRAISN